MWKGNRRAREYAVAYIQAHPVETLLRVPLKFWYMYNKDTDGFYETERGLERPSAIDRAAVWTGRITAQFYYLVILALFAGGAARQVRGRLRTMPTFSLWLFFYFTAVYVLFFGEPRFHFPVMPWLMMLGAMFLESRMVRDRTAAR